MVQRVAVAPPYRGSGPLSDSERAELVQRSPLKGRYDQPIDRRSRPTRCWRTRRAQS
ncbi:helicase HerA-like domain-containing protein [Pseudomonas aeruginosa]